jgi:hypothetical protein
MKLVFLIGVGLRFTEPISVLVLMTCNIIERPVSTKVNRKKEDTHVMQR